jgi:hypothetical protein
MTVRCTPWERLSSPSGPIWDIEFLTDGRLLGVGPGGLAVTWAGREATLEFLPAGARGDSLWAVAVQPEGTTTVFGRHTVLQRSTSGTWSVVRPSPRSWTDANRVAVLPDGRFVVADRAIHIWDRSSDSLPVSTLRPNVIGTPRVADLLVLADGRLVAGFTVPNEPTLGGWMQVWRSAIQADGFERVDLPRSIDITDLDTDGEFLYVVGRGGGWTIAIDSLFPGGGTRPD